VLHDFKDRSQYLTNYAAYLLGADPYGLLDRPPLRAGEVALDVGANLGLVSVLLALTSPSARVFALEPHPAVYRYLLWNLRANNVTDRVWPMRLGGCDTRRGRWVALWPWMPPAAYRAAPWLPREVLAALATRVRSRCVTLRELLLMLRARSVALLKVDCEGCEWGFLGWDGGNFLAEALAAPGRISRVVGELHHSGRAGRRLATLTRALCSRGPANSSRQGGCCNRELERCDAFFPRRVSSLRRPRGRGAVGRENTRTSVSLEPFPSGALHQWPGGHESRSHPKVTSLDVCPHCALCACALICPSS